MKKLYKFLLVGVLLILFSCQRNQEYNFDEMAEQTSESDSSFLNVEEENMYPSEENENDDYHFGDKSNSDRIKDYKTNPVSGIQINEQEWKEATEGVSYVEFEKPDKENKNNKTKRSDFNNYNLLFKIIVYTIGIAAIISLLFFLIRNFLKSKNEGKTSTIKDYNFREITEEELKLLETENLILQAEQANDYKSAFRLRYLQLLKRLLKINWIIFKKDYTNRDYLRQLSQRSIIHSFGILTLHFDSYWYGDIDINKEKYLHSIPIFQEIENDIKREAKP